MKLAGSRVLLTGASGGIGRALAEALLEAGASLLLVARRADSLADLVQQHPRQVQVVVADLACSTGLDAVQAAVEQTAVDILLHTAGISHFGLFEEQDEAAIQALLQTNLNAAILLSHRLLPLLRQRPHALLMHIGSVFGAIGYPGFSTYSASKFALRGFCEALRRELADSNVRVLYFAPRATRTPMNDSRVQAMNQALKVACDEPQTVARQVLKALREERPESCPGWPERIFARLNGIFPRLLDRALRGQLSTIQRFARQSQESQS